MQYEQGIEPLNPAGTFGNDYFIVNDRSIQEGAGEYMAPPDQDNWLSAVAQARGVDGERAAAQSSLYSNFLAGK
jgi:hypothetical protein